MKFVKITIVIAILITTNAAVAGQKRKHGTKVSKLCQKWTSEINDIDARLRHGYSASYGIRMEEKRRKIKAKKVKWCRNPKFKNQYINIR